MPRATSAEYALLLSFIERSLWLAANFSSLSVAQNSQRSQQVAQGRRCHALLAQCWTVPAYISRGLSQRGDTSPAKSHALTTTKEVTLRPDNGSLDAHDHRTGTCRPVQVIRSPPLSALDPRQAYGDGGGQQKVSGSGIAAT